MTVHTSFDFCPDPSDSTFGPQTEPPRFGLNGQMIQFFLQDRRPVPPEFPEAIIVEEGATLYWYYQVLNNFADYTTCSKELGGMRPFLVPDGWSLVDMVSINFADGVPAPFIAILTNPSAKQLSIIIRSVLFVSEWTVGRNHTLIESSFPGRTHAGITAIFQQVWPNVEATLQSQVTSGSVSHVTVAGINMGGGVAHLLGYKAQELLEAQRSPVVVGLVTIGAMTSGDAEWMRAFNKKINVRHVSYITDLFSQSPCEFPYCSSIGGDGETVFKYAEPAGAMQLVGARFPAQPALWSLFEQVELPHCDGYTFEVWHHATGDCSYQCYLSQFVGETKDACLLAQDAALLGSHSSCAYGDFPFEQFLPTTFIEQFLTTTTTTTTTTRTTTTTTTSTTTTTTSTTTTTTTTTATRTKTTTTTRGQLRMRLQLPTLFPKPSLVVPGTDFDLGDPIGSALTLKMNVLQNPGLERLPFGNA